MTPYLELSYLDLALAALLLVFNAALSLALGLRLEGRMLVAAARMVVQLLLVGLVLRALFEQASPWLTGSVALLMVLFAGREILANSGLPIVAAAALDDAAQKICQAVKDA